MNFACYVINLERSPDRWARVMGAADEAGLAIERIVAIDGASVPENEWRDIDRDAFGRLTGRAPLPGEYGCYRSHLAALDRFLKEGHSHGVILEDDVLPDASTIARIDAILETGVPFDVIKLVNHRTKFLMALAKTAEGDTIGRALHGPQGSAAAYLVSREGAIKLRKTLARMVLPFDVALERFWETGTRSYSVDSEVFAFSEDRLPSNITDTYGYDGSSVGQLLSTALFRLGEIVRRLHHNLLSPDGFSGRVLSADPSMGRKWQVAATVLLMAFASAIWVESDAYRVAGVILVVAGQVHYFRKDFWTYSKPLVGWAGLACVAWTFYVVARFAYSYLVHPGAGIGTSEAIYFLPLLYPPMGYALYLFFPRALPAIVLFMAISLVAMMADFDLGTVLAGERPWTWLHNNPIHASLAYGFVLIFSIPFTGYFIDRKDMSPGIRYALIALGALNFAMAMTSVLFLRSKGVWLALGIAFPVLVLAIALTERARIVRIVAAAYLGVAILVAVAFSEVILTSIEPTVEMIGSLQGAVASGEGLVSGMDRIAGTVASTSDWQRVALWSNALWLWLQDPFIGKGIGWLHIWAERPHELPATNLLHNSYFEILVRYGVIGLIFYVGLFAWATVQVWRAVREGLLPAGAFQAYLAALVYFAVAMFTNSNIRLAIGESYMWLAAGFGFYSYYLLQAAGRFQPRTYL